MLNDLFEWAAECRVAEVLYYTGLFLLLAPLFAGNF